MAASHHKYAPWRRAILVPFWVLQILLMLAISALLGLAIGVLNQYDANEDYGFGTQDAAVDRAVAVSTKM